MGGALMQVRGKRVYIAGPMTGYPRWNFDAFAQAAAALRAAGAIVTSPHEMDLANGFDPDDPRAGETFDFGAALDEDVMAVEAAEIVVLLPGWESSPGALIEVLTATAVGVPFVPLCEVPISV